MTGFPLGKEDDKVIAEMEWIITQHVPEISFCLSSYA